MSPDLVRLASPPSSARVVPGSPEVAFEEIVRERVEAAYASGVEAGVQQAVESTAGALAQASQTLEEVIETARDETARSSVELAVEIARHLLKAEVEAGRYDLERVVRETLAESGAGRANCTVHLNPKDLLRLEGVSFRSGTELEGDTGVAVGNVHVSAPEGLLVRDLDRAVESIGERILGELR